MNIRELLDERAKSHGDYTDHAACTQALKDCARMWPNWEKMTAPQRETFDMVFHKMGRILTGDPHFADHWVDMVGYTQLAADRTPEAK